MKKAIKEFIIEEHANACSEWKARWEERYPELFKPENKEGWYKYSDGGLVYYKGKDGDFVAYGFNSQGEWRDDNEMGVHFDLDLTPATKEEVETALKNHFEKRYLGSRVKSLVCDNLNEIVEKESIEKYCQYMYTDNSLNYLGLTVFKDGKWGEIIEEEKPEESDWKISNESNNYTISKKELQGISFTVENKNEEVQTITILGGESPLTINIPPSTTITINT